MIETTMSPAEFIKALFLHILQNGAEPHEVHGLLTTPYNESLYALLRRQDQLIQSRDGQAFGTHSLPLHLPGGERGMLYYVRGIGAWVMHTSISKMMVVTSPSIIENHSELDALLQDENLNPMTLALLFHPIHTLQEVARPYVVPIAELETLKRLLGLDLYVNLQTHSTLFSDSPSKADPLNVDPFTPTEEVHAMARRAVDLIPKLKQAPGLSRNASLAFHQLLALGTFLRSSDLMSRISQGKFKPVSGPEILGRAIDLNRSVAQTMEQLHNGNVTKLQVETNYTNLIALEGLIRPL